VGRVWAGPVKADFGLVFTPAVYQYADNVQAILSDNGLDSPCMGRPAQRERPAYGQHLAELREAAGLTQQQLAAKLGVQQSNIAFWERWDKPPRGDVLPKLAEALNVSADELLGIRAPKPKKQAAKGRLQVVFESASKLPRRQQRKIAEVVEALVAQHASG
jgi:transcriptional regulator with XRE-family HTH domain